MQAVHAGVGEETGGGLQGEDAIWSHRWYTFFGLIGVVGPSNGPLFGGFEIGDTDVWVGDYTIQPENGGLGVFAHEYAHDLGLPDAYDTAGGENGTGFWTIMSSGSYLGPGREDIGSRPGGFNAWELFQLGWLSYDVAFAGETSTHRVNPLGSSDDTSQAVFVILPDVLTTLELADPPEGEFAWYSDSGDNIDHTMTSIPIVVPTDDPTLRMSLWYQIELDWDYAYVSVSTDGGATWVNLEGNVTTNDNPNGQNFGNGITGSSGDWVAAEFGMSAYAGQTVQLQLRYWTDGAVVEPGILADEITLGSFFSGAEPGDEANWTLDGWRVTDGSEEVSSFNAYVAEVRQYLGYDHGLLTGPYNFSFVAKPDWVEHFPYQNGLLIWYWNDYYTDNNTSQHPGAGLILPVDSHLDQRLKPIETREGPQPPGWGPFSLAGSQLAQATGQVDDGGGGLGAFVPGPGFGTGQRLFQVLRGENRIADRSPVADCHLVETRRRLADDHLIVIGLPSNHGANRYHPGATAFQQR